MRGRSLRLRLKIYKPVPNESPTGNVETGWELVAERWAQKLPQRGRETFEAGRTQEEIPMTVRLRYDEVTSAILPSFRVGETGPELAIRSVADPDMMRRSIDLVVVTGIPG
jgi:SPP1 family predicted phage head-tail adaptor